MLVVHIFTNFLENATEHSWKTKVPTGSSRSILSSCQTRRPRNFRTSPLPRSHWPPRAWTDTLHRTSPQWPSPWTSWRFSAKRATCSRASSGSGTRQSCRRCPYKILQCKDITIKLITNCFSINLFQWE